jgi:Tol biopolymer transport system component
MNTLRKSIFLLIVISLSACSSSSSQTPASATSSLAPPSITTIPKATPTQAEPTPQAIPSIAQYGLAGRLVLIEYNETGNKLIDLNLQSGEIRTLFIAPPNSWLSSALVSPDEQQILLVYAPPLSDNTPQFGYSDLYLLPYDGSSQPKPFVTRKDPKESFFFPAWAPDGQSVYLTHLYRIDPNSQVPAYQNDIESVTLNGETKKIIDHALWPALSADGTRLSYLNVDPITFGNDLYLANPDGTNQTPILQPNVNPPVDAHLFTEDGNQVIFSMVNLQPAPAGSWLEKLFGVRVVSAHNVPSDWYIVSIGGGNPQPLTSLNDTGLYGDLSPDGTQMAFISASGLYVMKIDGSNLVQLSHDVLIGTVDWIR